MLVCRVGSRACALPVANVLETMRPLPVEPFADMPRFVRGLAIVRGEALPVVDGRALFACEPDAGAARFVRLAYGGRRAVLVVDVVLGVEWIDESALAHMPPLLGPHNGELAERVGAVDGALMVLLDAARVLP